MGGKVPRLWRVEHNGGNGRAPAAASKFSAAARPASALLTRPLTIQEIDSDDEERYHTGLSELDRVLGGGLVKGSLVLISGDPGIGKSTILLQICEYLGQNHRILYVSGEESARQIKLRAARLGVSSPNLRILSETDVQLVIEHIRAEKPDIVMVDSIQTMNFTDLNSSPGSVTQVRECTNAIMRCSKALDIPAILVGHVNKDGAIAGPKVLEHIVDAVLYFEGDRQMTYRILRAVKTDTAPQTKSAFLIWGRQATAPDREPSQAMLSGRPKNASGNLRHRRHGGHAPAARRNTGPRHDIRVRHAAAYVPGFDYGRMAILSPCWKKRAGFFFFESRRLSERRRRPAHR